MNLLRRLYDWVLHWAHTPFGEPALLLLAFAESSFFPVPPDVLLMALCLSLPERSLRYAAVATIGSVVGGLAGYGIGYGLWELTSSYFFDYIPGFTEGVFRQVQRQFEAYDFWVVFTAGFTPIPYKVITIGAGVFQLDLSGFALASTISRGLRFFIVAWLIYRYGAPIRAFIERYFNLLTLIFTLLLIGGFVALRLMT